MKQMLQIVGADMVNAKLVKITCIPYTTEQVQEKKPSIFDIAKGGAGVMELMQQAEATRSKLTVFFLDRETWINEFKNRLYSVIEVDINIGTLFGG